MLWTLSGVSSQALLQIIVVAILARLLVPEAFGVVGAALIFVSFASILSQIGMGPALVQRLSITEHHIRVAFTISTLIGFCLSILFYFIAPLISYFLRMPDAIP